MSVALLDYQSQHCEGIKMNVSLSDFKAAIVYNK